jgi:uncharacterized membrane protein
VKSPSATPAAKKSAPKAIESVARSAFTPLVVGRDVRISTDLDAHSNRRGSDADMSPKAPGLLLGIGLGGFVDGIVLHQILQWHHMLTSTGEYPMTTVAGLEANTLVDGFFHAATWVLVATGSWLSWRAWQAGSLAPPWRAHLGLLLAGWGAFNVVEGLIDHTLLGIHHVRDDLGGPVSWDIGFLIFGVLLVVIGRVLERSVSDLEARRG